MSRAHYEYNIDGWQELLENHGFTTAEVAVAIGVSERHIYNILDNSTATARFRTKKKIENGLAGKGVTSDKIEALFNRRQR